MSFKKSLSYSPLDQRFAGSNPPGVDGFFQSSKNSQYEFFRKARRAGSDGSLSASGSAGLGFDPRRGSKFSFEIFQPRG